MARVVEIPAEVRAHIEKISEELTKWMDTHLIGGVAAVDVHDQAALMVKQSVEKANTFPLERRIALALEMSGWGSEDDLLDTFDAQGISDVTYRVSDQDPLTILANFKLERTIDKVQVRYTISDA